MIRIIIALLVCLLTTNSYAVTYTTNYKLVKPEAGDRNWATIFSQDMDSIDSALITAVQSQDVFITFSGDTGSVTANSATDNFGFVGAGIVGTVVAGDEVTITGTEVDGDASNEIQNVWSVISADDTSTTANLSGDQINIVGSGIIGTSITSDTLTITGTEADTLATVTNRGSSTTGSITMNGQLDMNSNLIDNATTINAVGTITGGGFTDSTLSIDSGNITSVTLLSSDAVDTPEIANTGGDLKIQPDVQGDAVLFGDTDVDNEADGKALIISRKAAEFDRTISIYTDKYGVGQIKTNDYGLWLYPDDELILACGTNDYIGVGSSSLGSDFNIPFRQYGYITADTSAKYIQWQVNDTTDNFELTREDSNIKAFDIDMPTSIYAPLSADIASIDSSSLTFGVDEAGDNLIINVKNSSGNSKQVIIAFE